MNNLKNANDSLGNLMEQHRLKKEKLLLQMQKEIQQLELALNRAKLNNLSKRLLRQLNISFSTAQLAAPYILTAGIIAGAFSFLGNTPFYPKDKRKVYSSVMTEFDNLGNIRHEQQYGYFDYSLDTVRSYSKWELQANGSYARTIKTYKITTQTYEDLLVLFAQDDVSLEEIFGESETSIKETKPYLNETEMEEGAILQANLYRINEEDYIFRNETIGENILASLGYIVVTFCAERIPAYFRRKSFPFNYEGRIRAIKVTYPLTDLESLQKKLAIKKENYKRLTR